MVRLTTTRKTLLRISLAVCVAVLGVQTMQAQHAFEFASRIGANALLYESDYGKPMPNYNVGVDFSWKYRSPYYIGVRVGLGFDVAASTFVGRMPAEYNGLGTYADNYIVLRSEEPDHMLVDMNYHMDRLTETQQLLIASVPLQLGVFIGDFSMFLGARVGVPVHGCYWQRVRNSYMSLYFPDTDVAIPNAGQLDPNTDAPSSEDVFEDVTKAGNVARTVNGINTMSKDAFPLFSYHITAMVDVNYSFRIGDNTDLAIGAYLEYDPIGYSPAKTNNLSLMEWNYSIDDHTNEPVYRRDYTSVLEANRAPQNRDEGEAITGAQLVRKYNRTSVGLRVSVSLWNVPLEFGKNYRKQQLYKVCMCDFF